MGKFDEYYICVTFQFPLYRPDKNEYTRDTYFLEGGAGVDDFTRKFDFVLDQDAEIHRIMQTVYQALEEKGYNPVNQIVGYILSEDPTYVTNYKNARALIRKLDRDELLQELVKQYLSE